MKILISVSHLFEKGYSNINKPCNLAAKSCNFIRSNYQRVFEKLVLLLDSSIQPLRK